MVKWVFLVLTLSSSTTWESNNLKIADTRILWSSNWNERNILKLRAVRLMLRGGSLDPHLKKKSEKFWLPVLGMLQNSTRQFWEEDIRDIINLESTGEWTRVQPGEDLCDPETDLDDFINNDGDPGPIEKNLDDFEEHAHENSYGSRKAYELALKMGKGRNKTLELEWMKEVDDDQVDRHAIADFLEQFHGDPDPNLGKGRNSTDKSLYLHENETDDLMMTRHFFGYMTNETLADLRRLKIAAMYDDFVEIERLVVERGVQVDGLVDTVSRETALQYAAWLGRRGAVRKLVMLGADPVGRNYFNQTPAHRAACGGYIGVLEDLFDAGAPWNQTDGFMFTPGMWAADASENMTCQWLYARFVHRDENNRPSYPLGPPPHYGLPENIGLDYFNPFEKQEEIKFQLTNQAEVDELIREKEIDSEEKFHDIIEEQLMNDALVPEEEAGEERERQLKEEQARRQEELKQKRSKLVLGHAPDS